MRRWLIAAICLVAGAAAQAEPPNLLGRALADAPRSPRLPNFRIVQQSPLGPAPMRHSGLIIDHQVMPNGSVGLGLLTVTKRRSPIDWRSDSKAPKSRKLGVGFKLRF